VVVRFKNFCGLPHVNGVIDITQIHIQKPRGSFVGDYFSFKSKGFNMHLEVVVYHWKQFRNIFVGMFGLMNDTHILWISSLYRKVVNGELFWMNQVGERKIGPYIRADKGIYYYRGLWFLTNKLEMFTILYWRHYSMNIYVEVGVWLKIPSTFWRKHLENCFWKQIYMFFFYLMWWFVVAFFTTWFLMDRILTLTHC
jgi:hypothetical protein